MAGCALQPRTMVAFVCRLESVHDNRLHRPPPHPNRTREFSEESCGGIESESAAESRRTDSGPQQERRRLNRAPRRDHGPGPHMHGDGAAILLVGGLDAPHLAAFDVDRIRLRVEQEPSSRAVRSEEHTSELQSLAYLVCRLLLEKKKKKKTNNTRTINKN